jgi:hypothetical protein
MALRTEFSLINSEFNEFLFAEVGKEKNGMSLTVLSALTRLDIDPWGEAARLAVLPKEAAARALAVAIAAQAQGDWPPADSEAIAVRLVARLPRVGMSVAPPPSPAMSPEFRTMASIAAVWAFRITVAGTVFLALWQLQSVPMSAPTPGVATSAHP